MGIPVVSTMADFLHEQISHSPPSEAAIWYSLMLETPLVPLNRESPDKLPGRLYSKRYIFPAGVKNKEERLGRKPNHTRGKGEKRDRWRQEHWAVFSTVKVRTRLIFSPQNRMMWRKQDYKFEICISVLDMTVELARLEISNM